MKKIAAGILALLLLITGCADRTNRAGDTGEESAYVPPENPVELTPAAPEQDFFTGAEFLDLNGITGDDLGAVALRVWFEDGTEGELLLTDRAAVQTVYGTFADAEIAWDIILNTNPSTGDQLDMDWYLTDGTVLRFYMRYYVGIEGIDGHFLFSSGASQYDYIDLYKRYADT